jgi:8-oxo-dGTP pyrophosphatase MutT (NUDIX family)
MDTIDDFEEVHLDREPLWQTRKRIAAYRTCVLANGYRPIPVNGKAPHIPGWTDLAATPDIIKRWSDEHPDHVNTGILTRTAPTFDIDVPEPEAAEAVEALVRELFEERGYILVRIGRAPKRCIPFRTDVPFEKIIRSFVKPGTDIDCKLELLANGQQVVVDGAHPDTQRPYTWHGGSLDQIKHEDLPYITEGEARDLVDRAAQLLVNDYGYVEDAVKAKAKNGNDASDDFGDYDSRADWSALVDSILKGHALHDSIRDLAAAVVSSGMYDTAAERLIRSLMEASAAARDTRWQQRFDDIRRAVKTARKKFGDSREFEDARNDGSCSVTVKETPWPTMDEAAYHGLAGDIVRTIKPHTEADPVAILIQFLIYFGNVIGDTAHYKHEEDVHHTNLFCILVGASGRSRKGVSGNRAKSVFKGVDEIWEASRMKGGLSSGEGLIEEVRDEVKRWNVKDQVEEIVDPGVKDKRLVVTETEYGRVLAACGRQGNILSAILRQAWDSSKLSTMTRNSPLTATAPHISLIGHITPDELRAQLTRTDAANGYANRNCWCGAPRIFRMGGISGARSLSRYDGALRKLSSSARPPVS